MSRASIIRVVTYLVLTFAISWGFDLGVGALGAGRGTYAELGMTPWGMFVPAFVALFLQLFVFADSPITSRSCDRRLRVILLGFLVLTLLYGSITVLAVVAPDAANWCRGVGTLLITIWTLLVLSLGGKIASPVLDKSGLALGDVKLGRRFVAGIVVFLLLQAGLNLLLGLGEFRGILNRIYGVPVPEAAYPFVLIVLFASVTVIGMPLSGLAAVFGEEYGWRGFLQGELAKLGNLRGALLVGLVWALWHFPVILRGIHTYPPSWVGLLLGIAFFTLWGLVQSYAVLKTGSLWIPAFMHGVVNSVYAFVLEYLVRPLDKVMSFGLGVYGLACMALIVAAILRDPVWAGKEGRVPRPWRS